MIAEEARHFIGRLEVALGIGLQQIACFSHLHALADGRHHILQHAAGAVVVEHVIGGEKPRLVLARDLGQPVQPLAVIAAIMVADCEVERGLEALAKRGEMFHAL